MAWVKEARRQSERNKKSVNRKDRGSRQEVPPILFVFVFCCIVLIICLCLLSCPCNCCVRCTVETEANSVSSLCRLVFPWLCCGDVEGKEGEEEDGGKTWELLVFSFPSFFFPRTVSCRLMERRVDTRHAVLKRRLKESARPGENKETEDSEQEREKQKVKPFFLEDDDGVWCLVFGGQLETRKEAVGEEQILENLKHVLYDAQDPLCLRLCLSWSLLTGENAEGKRKQKERKRVLSEDKTFLVAVFR